MVCPLWRGVGAWPWPLAVVYLLPGWVQMRMILV